MTDLDVAIRARLVLADKLGYEIKQRADIPEPTEPPMVERTKPYLRDRRAGDPCDFGECTETKTLLRVNATGQPGIFMCERHATQRWVSVDDEPNDLAWFDRHRYRAPAERSDDA